MSKENIFDVLNAINVNDHTEDKNKLTYLSWVWAWAEFKKKCPNATYEVVKFDDGKPYFYDENTGYMVYTRVTVDGLTHEMWLPVMDFNNNAMKNETYVVKTKYKEVEVQPATMFDINKTIMRCLTKNLAMFGLGLYIYAGEDLPEAEREVEVDKRATAKKTTDPRKETAAETEIKKFINYANHLNADYKEIGKRVGAKSLKTMTNEQIGQAMQILKGIEEGA